MWKLVTETLSCRNVGPSIGQVRAILGPDALGSVNNEQLKFRQDKNNDHRNVRKILKRRNGHVTRENPSWRA